MATADKSNLFSNLFRDIGKPGGGIAPTTMLAIGILALLGVVAGGFLLHTRLDKLETELALAKRDAESTQREVSQIRQDQSSAAAMIARLDNRLSAMAQPTSPQSNVLQITAVEAKLIREFLMKIDAFKPRVEAGHKVGDTIPEDRLLDFSAVLTQGVPKLKNTNYTIDQNGSIIIVSENRIVAILDFVNVARWKRGIQYVERTEGDGGEMFKAVCKLGLEGIVSKKLDAPYKSGPSKAWLKIKNPKAPAATRAADGTF